MFCVPTNLDLSSDLSSVLYALHLNEYVKHPAANIGTLTMAMPN